MKVAIVGTAPSSRMLAPFSDDSWEIWACSPSNQGPKLPRITRWFELHALDDLRSARWSSWAPSYVHWMNTLSCAIYMQEANEMVPSAIPYPMDHVVGSLCANAKQTFLTSSPALMMALALYENFEEIGIYGVDMATASEWEFERPGMQYWIERARQRGVKVTVPNTSDLDIAAPIYGFSDASPMARKLKEHAYELQAMIDKDQARMAQLDQERNGLVLAIEGKRGALGELNHIRKTYVAWSGPDLK